MIVHEFFTYTDAQWNEIKTVFRDARHLDADQIERQVTFHYNGADFEESFTGMQPLRARIEIAVNQYSLHSAVNRLSPRGDDLGTLRENAENLRDRIIDTVAVPFGTKYDFDPHPLLLHGVDADMLPATRDYFRKLLANLDRMITHAGSRGDNARKTARDKVWNELLATWCELGGEPRGKAAANFLIAASKPVMGSAVPTLTSVVQWLERRQNKTAKTAKPVLRPQTR